MAKAIWKDVVLAESDQCRIVENNFYFPPDSLHREYFIDSPTHTVCGWKGMASYYTVQVDGEKNPDAAWYYAEPKAEAQQIKGYVAFWKGVRVEP